MKRRELIKKGLLGLGIGAAALTGCNKNEQNVSNNDNEFKIVPKQTAIYEFSTPLPFNYKTIDEIIELNGKYKKLKITSMYNNIPQPFTDRYNQWLQISRGGNSNIKSYDDFAKYVKRIRDNGIRFVYLLNSPKPFSPKDFLTFKDDFLRLLDFLKKIECKDIKIGNTQVADIINQYAPGEFNFSASTTFEFHTISQYENLFTTYPNFNLLDLTYDENQNFKLLQSLKTRFPKIKVEVMVNESCIKGCPSRIAHMSEYLFCKYNCFGLIDKIGCSAHTFKKSTIFPWDLGYYSALGINNFKYIAYGFRIQKPNTRNDYWNIECLENYLDTVENYNPKMPASDFMIKSFIFDYSLSNDDLIKALKGVTIAELRKYIPDIRFFVKNGDKCANRCRVTCNYCYDCAKKLDNILLYSNKA